MINKIKYDIEHNRKRRILYLLLFFLFLSFLAMFPFWQTGFLYSGPDMQFHTSRIQEMYEDLSHGQFIPGIATHTFNKVGDMVVSSYPWVTLYPFAILMFLFKPVSAIYIGMLICIFATLLISYFSMYIISKSSKISLYFSLLYGYTSFFIFNILDFEFGTFLAYIFFPLAFSGLYLIMFSDYHKWYILTFGAIGVMYSHTPSTLILIFSLFIVYFALLKKQNKSEIKTRFFYLCVSAFSTLLLSLIVWVPIINMLLNQKVDRPQPQVLTNGAEDLGHILFNTFSDYGFNGGIGIAILLALITGPFYFHKVGTFARAMYISGVITIFVISIIFPWYVISMIPILNTIDGIQLTERIYPIAIMFLSGYGAYLLNYFDSKSINYKRISKIIVLVIVVAGYVTGVAGIDLNPNLDGSSGLQHQPELNYKATFGNQVPKNSIGLEWYKVNSEEYYNQFDEENATGMTDYIPLKSSGTNFGSIAFHNLNYGDKYVSLKDQSMKSDNDSITYFSPVKLTQGTYINLPFIYYSGINYQVSVDGKKVNYSKSSDRNTVSFTMPFTSEKPIIEVKYLGSSVNKLSSFISVISWILLISYVFYFNSKYYKERKSNEKLFN